MDVKGVEVVVVGFFSVDSHSRAHADEARNGSVKGDD